MNKRKKRKRRQYSSTPYDDAFKTLITGSSEIVIPFLNEMFPDGDPIPEDAILVNEKDEFLIKRIDGRQDKVITDSCMRYGRRAFHVECQSNPDGTMLIRMFEYDVQIALSRKDLRGRCS